MRVESGPLPTSTRTQPKLRGEGRALTSRQAASTRARGRGLWVTGTGSHGTGCEKGAASQALATHGLAPCQDSWPWGGHRATAGTPVLLRLPRPLSWEGRVVSGQAQADHSGPSTGRQCAPGRGLVPSSLQGCCPHTEATTSPSRSPASSAQPPSWEGRACGGDGLPSDRSDVTLMCL